MSSHSDLNGIWSGVYHYPSFAGEMSVAFTAWLDDLSGCLSGSILETNTFAEGGPAELSAEVSGQRSGVEIQFEKRYLDGQNAHDQVIFYAGSADPDFTYVSGEWRFPNLAYAQGTFAMSRSSDGHEARAERARSKEVV